MTLLGGTPPSRRQDRLRANLEAKGVLDVALSALERHPNATPDLAFGRDRLGHIVEARAHVVYDLVDVVGSIHGVATLLELDCSSVNYLRGKWARIVGDVGRRVTGGRQ